MHIYNYVGDFNTHLLISAEETVRNNHEYVNFVKSLYTNCVSIYIQIN